MTQECRHIRGLLDSHVGGEASASEQLEVEAHVASCVRCAREAKARERLRQALRAAVEGTAGAPADLRDQIRARVRRETPTPSSTWRLLAAAAALIVAVGAWTALEHGPGFRDSIARSTSADDVAFLDVGLKHHVHCVGERPPATAAPSPESLEANLGEDYSGLVAVAREHAPSDLTVADAHRCSSIGRRFVHVVLRGEDGLVSLLVTERGQTDLPREIALGAPSAGGLGVSGFATPEHLVYVVSGASNAPAPEVASAVGPAVRQFLIANRA